MKTLRLARFLAEVRVRARTEIPPEIDPIGIIMLRVGLHPNTPESRALTKATLAVIAMDGEMNEVDLWSLSSDALGLLDAFAEQRLTGRYSKEALDIVAARLRTMASASA